MWTCAVAGAGTTLIGVDDHTDTGITGKPRRHLFGSQQPRHTPPLNHNQLTGLQPLRGPPHLTTVRLLPVDARQLGGVDVHEPQPRVDLLGFGPIRLDQRLVDTGHHGGWNMPTPRHVRGPIGCSRPAAPSAT